jgi:hypothetical protein
MMNPDKSALYPVKLRSFLTIFYCLALALPAFLEADPAPFGPPVREVDGWKESSWFGWYQDHHYPSVHHVEHGWCYVASGGGWVIWWDYRLEEWFATANSVYPFVYRYVDERWLWYFRGTIRPRWFVDSVAFSLTEVPDNLYFVELPGSLVTLSQRYPSVAGFYPEEGPPGTTVYFEFQDEIEGLDSHLKIYYEEKEIPIDRMAGKLLVARVPEDAASGFFDIRVDGDLTDFEVFFVMEPSATPLLTRDLQPSSSPQVISHGSEIQVEIPGGFLDRGRALSISRMEHPPANSIQPGAVDAVYDITFDGLSQLPGFLKIRIPYDASRLDPGLPVDWQLMALLWDETDQVWYQLPYTVNPGTQTIEAYTDHLSLVGVGLIFAGITAASKVGEYVLNDVYTTPQGNFRFLYSKSAMNADPVFGSYWNSWRPTGFSVTHDPKYPVYIQDLGAVFEASLAHYMSQGFRNPIHAGRLWGHYPIVVKIDSFWSKATGLGTSDPQYEKIWQNLHMPTYELQSFTADRASYAVIGHELFHRMQAEYYSRLAYRQKAHFWWIEATAEYAGSRAAFGNIQLNLMRQGIKADFLRYPISTSGIPHKGWKDKAYEYAASVLIEYLVEVEGFSFKELVEHVAGGTPFARLEEWCQSKRNLSFGEMYSRFAAWAMFAGEGFLSPFPLATFSGSGSSSNEIVEHKATLDLTGAQTIRASVTGTPGVQVDVYVLAEGERMPGNAIPYPMATLQADNSWELSGLANGDVAYFVAVNSNLTASSVNIHLQVLNAEGGAVAELRQDLSVAGPYAAGTYAVKMTADEKVFPLELDCTRDYLLSALRLTINGSGSIRSDSATTVFMQGECFGKTVYVNRKSKAGPPALFSFPYTVDVQVNDSSQGWIPGTLSQSFKASSGGGYAYRIITLRNPRTVITNVAEGWSTSTQSFGNAQLTISPSQWWDPVQLSGRYRI